MQEFAASLSARDPKTVTTYLTTVRDFVAWLALQPGGAVFHLGLVTETAVRGYMNFLTTTNRVPRTRSKALSALRRFCQWAVDEGHLRRNPAREMERPTVVAVAPTELSEKQRFVLKTMVEQHATLRFAAIFALGYWAGLRISEIAALLFAQAGIQSPGFHGCDGHALPIHWTKGTYSITHDDEAFRQPRQPLIVPPAVGGVLIHYDGSDRFGLLDGYINLALPHASDNYSS